MRQALLALLTLVVISGCGGAQDDPQAEIRTWLAAGEAAVEDKDRRALVRMISADYVDRQGNDRAAIDKLLRYYFLRQDDIALLMRVDSIDVFDGTAAEVALTVGMAGTSSGSFGLDADAQRFALELERNEGDWQLISARWGGLNESL